jgi:SAM-dependent methyltransferase
VILCPDCQEPYAGLQEPRCLYCGWELQEEDELPVMLATRDREDVTFNQYVANYAENAHADLTDSIQDPALIERQIDRLVRLAGPVRDLDVCDVGVGQGGLLTRWRALGAGSVTGVDIATPFLRPLQGSGARLIVANAENLPFRSEFDVLVAADILEHVLNPGDMLLSAHEALRRDGRFVVRVPYREDLRHYGQLRRAPHRFVQRPGFTCRVLRLMLEQAGFRIERMAFDGFLPDRLRPALRRHDRVHRRVREFLDGRYRTPAHLNAMNVHLGRLLFRPKTLTAVARRECS